MSGDSGALQLLMLLALALADQVLQVSDLVHADLLVVDESLPTHLLTCGLLLLLDQLLSTGAPLDISELSAS